jgi:hypothetical protein
MAVALFRNDVVTGRMVRAKQMTGSNLDDWIY